MSVQPVDLQALFVRLADVGRDQQAIQQSAVQSQASAASNLQEEAELQRSGVQQTEETEDSEAVGEDAGNAAGNGNARGRKQQQQEQSDAPPVFTDPALGNNIDMQG